MAANASARRIRSQLLNSTLELHHDWVLEAECGRCHTARERSVLGLIQLYGRHLTLMPIVNRLRCIECGRPPIRVMLVHRALERSIVLVGSEYRNGR